MQEFCKEDSFEWSHHRILSTDCKVRTTVHIHAFIIDSGGVNRPNLFVTFQHQRKLNL